MLLTCGIADHHNITIARIYAAREKLAALRGQWADLLAEANSQGLVVVVENKVEPKKKTAGGAGATQPRSGTQAADEVEEEVSEPANADGSRLDDAADWAPVAARIGETGGRKPTGRKPAARRRQVCDITEPVCRPLF